MGSLGEDDLLFYFERWGRVHMVGDQAIQSGALSINAAVRYGSHLPHVAASTCTDGIKSINF